MNRVIFISADGLSTQEVGVAGGENLLKIAQANGQPLEGTCEGQMACSTCHVLVNPADFASLPPASEMEEDLLDLAAGVTRYSRLSCQVQIPSCSDSFTVTIPPEQRNMQGR